MFILLCILLLPYSGHHTLCSVPTLQVNKTEGKWAKGVYSRSLVIQYIVEIHTKVCLNGELKSPFI